MKHQAKKNAERSDEGFVLVLTMLIVSIMMAISFSIYTISIKEVVLGAYMRDSERAFMAADRALECALFWDRSISPGPNSLQYSPFPTSTAWTSSSINMANVTCNTGASDVRLDNGSAPSGNPTGWDTHAAELTATHGRTTFSFNYSDGVYADIEVVKDGINTTITANGYNTPPPFGNRTTQRTIFARYNL